MLRVGNERKAREELLVKLDQLRKESKADSFNPEIQSDQPNADNSNQKVSNSHNFSFDGGNSGGGGGAFNPLAVLMMLIPGIIIFSLRRNKD